MDDLWKLTNVVRETAFAIHTYLKHGHLEKVYENALMHRLLKAGVPAKQQSPIGVFDEDGTRLGEYFADLFIDDVLIVEIKAARALSPEHEAQLIGYLRSTRVEHGLLINFGAPRFQIRKYVLSRVVGPGRSSD
jgi:GxxExxY protein